MDFIQTKIYAVKHKDQNIILNSSSGGLFTALSDSFLKNGNAIASCVYNCDLDQVEFKVYQDVNTMLTLQKSYTKSILTLLTPQETS